MKYNFEGKPKGAVLTHHSMLNSTYSTGYVCDVPDGMRMVCNPIPFFHIMGFASGILLPLLFGSAKVFPFYFPDTLFTLKAIHGYRCNTMRGTPTQFIGF
jgi:fatty-acyl-CoA synthase